MRVILSRVLLGASILSLAACLVLGVDLFDSYQEAVATDDFAGFSLGMHFLLYALAPLTLSLFLAVCLLDPPTWLLKRLEIGTSPSQSSTSTLRTAVVGLCLAGAVVIFLYVAYFVGGNLVAAARHYDYSYPGLALILLQNLAFSSPLLMLGALLAWTGQALRKLRSTA